jgi:hypothetical protein
MMLVSCSCLEFYFPLFYNFRIGTIEIESLGLVGPAAEFICFIWVFDSAGSAGCGRA